VIGLLRALLEEEADLTHPRLVRLPEALRDRVDLDLQILDARDQRALEVLAVVDGRIDPVDLRGIAGFAMKELGEILERLCRVGFVAESGGGTDLRYEVAHPIIQVAVYDAIGGTRRRALHRTVAETLLASGGLGLAAMHYARSGERGDAEAIRVLCRALRQAEDRGLYQEALTILGALLDILPEGDNRWLLVLDAMAWQADWVLSHLAEGDTTVAVRAMEQVRGPADAAGDPRAQAAVRFYLASFLSFGLCQLGQAAEECRAAIELFERAGDSEGALLATNELAWIQGCAGNLAADADLALEVCGKADTAGLRRVKILAAGTAGYALGMLGRFDEAEVLFGQSIELAEVEGSTYRLAWSRAQLGAIRSMRGPLDDAIASVEASLDADLAAPDALALEYMAQCTWLNGRLESALSWLDQSAVRRPINGSRRRAWGQALAARLHAEMGHPVRAEQLIGSAKSAYADSDLLTWSVWCWWNEGVLAWMIGDAERSSTALDRALQRLADMGAVALEALVLADVAEIAADVGQVDRAAASAARSITVSEVCGGALAPALARLALGWSDLAGGRPEAVIEPAGQVAEALSSAGYRFHAAIASGLLARATEQHDRASAVERLRDAAESFEACGALWRRDRTLRRLGHLGGRGRVAAAAGRGPESLTDRERDVALLARRGYTAREIGERLFIGRRTVESHLQTIYSKLGVRSKRDLVRYLDDVGFR
jgi:DNA-binding CsgD family transcriptional regulator